MTRLDLFLAVHKGLRAELFETARLVARSDFSVPAEARAAAARVQRSFAFLEEHARHEDELIFAELEARAPVLCAELRNEHSRVDGLMLEITRLLARLDECAPAERVSLGRRLHGLVGSFLAEYLRHMEREEGETNRMLWAHFSDEQLGAMQGRIISAIEPARLAQWMELILPELNASERAALLAGAGEAA
jgi:Hemerythrin HHE cation binding domain